MKRWNALLVCLLAACAAHAADAPAESAPTPYTAEQLRDASRVGRTYEFRIERPGAPTMVQRMVFVAVTPERATVESTMFDEQDHVTSGPTRGEATWEDLRKHALYPKAGTTIEAATVTTPAGTFPCKRYTVVSPTDKGESRTVACFADNLPGPPVEMRRELAGQPVMTMTLMRHVPGAAK